MSGRIHNATGTLAPFVNEPFIDFSVPSQREAMEKAAALVRSQFGREYHLHIDGKHHHTDAKHHSLNPANPSEVVGIHQMATPEMANQAVESAHAYFEEWSATPMGARVGMALRAAEIIRERKLELDAWLVYEAGKTWNEAEADVSEAIDFLNYYARQMLKFSEPDPLVQMPGEHGRLISGPGCGHHHSALEFPAGHYGRHERGRSGYGQHHSDQALQRHAHHRREVR